LFLLSTCGLQFQLVEPSIELNAQTAYQSGQNIVVDYKFTADEPALRCRYAVDKEGSILHQGVTGQFPPGTWQRLEFAFDSGAAEGEYTLSLLAQALRGDAFVDLSSLSKRVAFFFDFSAPVEPQVSPSGGLYNIAVPVALSHQEWVAPTGSPVSVYYTTDHTDPTAGSSRYQVGTPVVLELSENSTELRAIAIDDSGRTSTIESEIYSFINIDHMHSTSEDGPQNVFYTGKSPQFIYLHGYGLDSVEIAEFADVDNTPATTAAVIEKNGTQVILAISIPLDGSFAGDGSTMDGTLRVFAAGGVSDDIRIDLLPGLPPP
jgi:hypothetical protein